MSSDAITVLCPGCGAKNSVPKKEWPDGRTCGTCERPLDLPSLFADRTIEVTDATFEREVVNFPGPVFVDFAALW